ncbi:uncharacterized protein J3D65DRAFT_689850 [Phyllosticta citribraziliensis]|uniref:DUF6604 domain-containing protein n=1 Tax=Phyllosticta citribraziliensis TaxID=989973 RepID=A0ABR1M3G3_9PEZI
MADTSSRQISQEDTDRLESRELDTIRANYTNRTKRFTNWIETNAKKHGWREAMTPTSPRSWNREVEKLRKYRRSLNERLGFVEIQESRELESPFFGESVLKIAQQADLLNLQGVTLPRQEQASLEGCIDLRKKANRHFSTFTRRDFGTFEQYQKHLESNRNHEFFIAVIYYILRMLWDPRHYFAMKLYRLMIDMRSMTFEVMDAWKQYRKTGMGLIQASLIARGAATRSLKMEREFFEQMMEETGEDEKLLEILHEWQSERCVAALNVENDEYPPTFLADVRGLLLLDQEDQKISSMTTLKDHLELLHYPTIPVLNNFRAISKLWDSQKKKVPVPGYPVDLGHVYPGDRFNKPQSKPGQGKKRKLDKNQLESRKKLKTAYDEQIQLTWKYLNDIRLLYSYSAIVDPSGGEPILDPQKPDRPRPSYLGTDYFSVCLNHVVEGNSDVFMGVSYTVQLLVKISQLFDENMINKQELLYRQTHKEVNDEAGEEPYFKNRMVYRDYHDSSKSRKGIYEDNWGFTQERVVKNCLRQSGETIFSAKFEWAVDNEGNETYHVAEGRSRRTVPIPEDDQLSKIDKAPHFPVKRMEVNWFAGLGLEGGQFYLKNQPLYVGELALRRRLVDYKADIEIMNGHLSVFVLVHLIMALNVMDGESDPKARQDQAILDQCPEWFPAVIPANATALLQLVETRLPRTGDGQYDFSGTKIQVPKPVQTLWEIAMECEEDVGLDLFARQLEEYGAEVQAPQQAPPNRVRRPLSWPKFVGILKRCLPKLACADVERDYYRLGFTYVEYLGKVGKEIGFIHDEEKESLTMYNTRLLYYILDDFKHKEDLSISMKASGRKPKGWRAKTHLSKVKNILAAKDEEAKKAEKERKGALEAMNKR